METVNRNLVCIERWILHHQTEEGVMEELEAIQDHIVRIDRNIDVARIMNKVMKKQGGGIDMGDATKFVALQKRK
jgi:hypothetical protein